VYGIAGDAIGSTATGPIILEGFWNNANALKVDGTGTAIAIGDFITTSATAGTGQKAVAGDTAIAIAMAAASTVTSIKAMIIRPRKV
jgi:hypothetical protein